MFLLLHKMDMTLWSFYHHILCEAYTFLTPACNEIVLYSSPTSYLSERKHKSLLFCNVHPVWFNHVAGTIWSTDRSVYEKRGGEEKAKERPIWFQIELVDNRSLQTCLRPWGIHHEFPMQSCRVQHVSIINARSLILFKEWGGRGLGNLYTLVIHIFFVKNLINRFINISKKRRDHWSFLSACISCLLLLLSLL